MTRANWAIDCDATDDYISIASPSASMPDADDSFTVESWVYLDSHITNSYLYYWGDDGVNNTQNAAHFWNGDSFGHAGWYNDLNVVVGDQSGKWLHWAVVYDSAASSRRLYIDAVEVGSDSPANFTVSANGRNFKLGATGDTVSGFLDGKMAEFRVWAEPRSVAQLQEYMWKRALGTETNLIVCFPLDEGTGTTATDIALGGDGTLNGFTAGSEWTDGPPITPGAGARQI